MMLSFFLNATLFALATASPLQDTSRPITNKPQHEPRQQTSKPGPVARFETSQPIPNRYIVEYHDGVDAKTRERDMATTHQAAVRFSSHDIRYAGVKRKYTIGEFSGYHGELHPEQVVQLGESELVKTITPDIYIHLMSSSSSSLPPKIGITEKLPPPPNNVRTVHASAWGQARISHRHRPASPSYVYETAPAPTVYVIDTGVDIGHWQFTSPFYDSENFKNNSRWYGPGPETETDTEVGVRGDRISRARLGPNFSPFSFPSPSSSSSDPGDPEDHHFLPHGTHVAATIAGRTLGIAPSSQIVSLQIFSSNGSSSLSALLAAIAYATVSSTSLSSTSTSTSTVNPVYTNGTFTSNANDNATVNANSNGSAANASTTNGGVPSASKGRGYSIINMSLGIGHSPVLNAAVNAAVSAGLIIVVAAGNNNDNATLLSPASAEGAITVGAIDSADTRCGFSNWGESLSVFAPGEDILSAIPGPGPPGPIPGTSGISGKEIPGRKNNDTALMSGTSMASPHVAGLAAYFIHLYGPHTPAKMRARIEGLATVGMVKDAGKGSPNRIAFNGNLAEM